MLVNIPKLLEQLGQLIFLYVHLSVLDDTLSIKAALFSKKGKITQLYLSYI